MSDLGPLLRKFTALASERPVFRDGLRVLSNGVFPPPLPALLDEIEATVLKRELTLVAGESRLCLTVAGRRLLGLTAISDDLGEWRSLIGQSLSQDDPQNIEMVATLLAAFTADEQPILLATAPATRAPVAVGISVARLWEVLEIDEPLRPVQLFIETCEPWYAACLFRSGGLWIGHSDDEALLARLRDLAEAQADRFRAACRGGDQPGDAPHLIILERVLDDSLSIAATWAQDDFAIFAHAEAEAATIHAAWRRIFTL